MAADDQLSPKQLIFVQEYLKSNNITHAAKAAGYAEGSAHVQGSRMLKNDKIQRYLSKKEQNLNRDLRELFVEEAAMAFKTMVDLAKNSPQDNVRYSAAKDILDRAGYKPVDKVVADVTTRSYEDQLAELVEDE